MPIAANREKKRIFAAKSKTTMKIGIIIAMDVEYRMMHDAIGGDCGRLGNNEIILWRCGVGNVNAAVGTMRLLQQHHPDAIISTGLAGGIDPLLNVMDIFVATQCVYHDVDCGGISEDGPCVLGQVQGLPARFDAAQHLLDCALAVPLAGNERRVTGLICTGDQFITDRERQNTIKRHFPDGLACDMESAAIAQTCYLMNVPFISLRIISDTPGRTDDHQMQWADFLASMCGTSFHFVKKYLETL